MLKSCRVTFIDRDDISHTVTVQAEALFEAVLLAAGVIRQAAWGAAIGPGSKLVVEVHPSDPVPTHTVRYGKALEWLDQQAKSPKDILLKQRLKLVVKA